MKNLLYIIAIVTVLLSACSGGRPNETSMDKTSLQNSLAMGEECALHGKHGEAIKRFLSSYEEAKMHRDSLTQALAAERIADMLAATYNVREANKFSHEAIDIYLRIGEDFKRLRAQSKLKSMNLYSQKTSRRLSIIDSTLNAASSQGHLFSEIEKYSDIYGLSASTSLGMSDYRLEPWFDLLRNSLDGRTRIEANIFSSIVLRLQDRSQEADSLLNDAERFVNSNEDKVIILNARYLKARRENETLAALTLADSLIFYQEAITDDIIKANVTSALKEFYAEKAAENQRESQNYRYVLICAIASFLLITLILWRFFRLKTIAQKAELEANVEALINMKAYADMIASEKDALNREIDCIRKEHTDQLEQRKTVLESLFRQKWHTLNKLCEEYFVCGISKKQRESLTEKIEVEIRKISSEEGLLQVEEEVNSYMDAIVKKLRKECPYLKNKDIAFCTLTFAGFSVKAICFILGIQSGYFYVKKGRLIKKLSESDAPHRDLFISYMA